MKKSNVMRMLSLVLVLTLISTTAICGTFAKYITSDSATDTARVAKFGVLVSIEGNLFGSSYSGDSHKIQTWGEHAETVSSVASTNEVVAPGTKGDVMSFSIKGTPEVSTAVTFGDALTEQGISAKAHDSDIVLGVGEYGVMVEWTGIKTVETVVGKYMLAGSKYTEVTSTSAADAVNQTKLYELKDVASVAADYYPLDWYVGAESTSGTEPTGKMFKSVGAAKANLDDTFVNKTFTPNSANDLSQTITWDWDFQESAPLAENSIYYTNDKADTILGDMIAADLAASDPIAVVVKTSTGDGAKEYTTLQYAKNVPVGTTDSTTFADVVYIGNSAPETAPTSVAAGTTLPSGMYAVLTANFQASVTVTQVD